MLRNSNLLMFLCRVVSHFLCYENQINAIYLVDYNVRDKQKMFCNGESIKLTFKKCLYCEVVSIKLLLCNTEDSVREKCQRCAIS